jgi:hypothetical protein
MGANVPRPGEGVVGVADGAPSFSEIGITTSKDGVVTITGRTNDMTLRPEICVLPRLFDADVGHVQKRVPFS